MTQVDIAARMIRAREKWIDVGGFRFLIRRPTDGDLIEIRSRAVAGGVGLETVRTAVVAWEGVRECDLFPGGGETPVEFSRRVWELLIGDRPDLWDGLSAQIVGAIDAHVAEVEALRKNSESSSERKTSAS